MYTQGVCDDGAAILYNGVPSSIEEILEKLNDYEKSKAEVELLATQLFYKYLPVRVGFKILKC